MIAKKIKTQIKKELEDFSESKDQFSGIFNYFYKHPVHSSYEKWRLVRFIFDEILKFKIFDQPIEKVNWEIPFIYKQKYHCSVSHQKFGFRIYIDNKNTKISEKIAREIEETIEKALKYSEPIIKDHANKALEHGDISINNRCHELQQTYEYFKSEVIKRKKILKIPISKKTDYTKRIKSLNEISHLEQAGYVAFFSLLEHLCILTLAFRDIPERNDVKGFTRKIWKDKFKIVFDLAQKEFKESYDYLLNISRHKRNPNVHGLMRSNFHFYFLPAKHRISVGLYDQEILLQWQDEELNFKNLDAFLSLLANHKSTKRIWKYINSGLNIIFGEHAENINQFPSDKDFDEFLEYQIYRADNVGNMDW